LNRDHRQGSFTLMLIPHSDGRTRVFRLRWSWLRALLCFAVAFSAALTWFGFSYSGMLRNMDELHYLRVVTAQQRTEMEYLSREAAALLKDMKRIQELDRQVRDLLTAEKSGNSNSAASVVSIAGTRLASRGILNLSADRGLGLTELDNEFAPKPTGILGTLQEIKEQLPVQQNSLVQLKEALLERQAMLAAYPSLWPASGYISSGFGYRRNPFGSGYDYHYGVDVAAPYGSPIFATGDGIVIFSGYKSAYGRTVMIDHGYGYTTLYSHNAKNLVEVGQKVKKGQLIALVGLTGRTTGPHVHYEVWVNGIRVNPKQFMTSEQ